MVVASGGWEQVVATEKKEKPDKQEKVCFTIFKYLIWF